MERHIESGLPDCPLELTSPEEQVAPRWQHVVVIPAYRENPTFLQRLASLRAAQGRALVLLVLNRPDSDHSLHSNDPVRGAIDDLPDANSHAYGSQLKALNDSTELYCLDTEKTHGALPSKEGVGLARKLGCDTALLWMEQGHIAKNWIHTSDADAAVPANYFEATTRLARNDVAATYPFGHHGSSNPDAVHTNNATALYELRLHHYVLGLEFARSPYAFHTLGSCIAIRPEAYAAVRGFPKRAAAEDFYVLNKLAKTGNIKALNSPLLFLEARQSTRVPFGTGPAVAQLIEGSDYQAAAIFYHPACFIALRYVLEALPHLARNTATYLEDIAEHTHIDGRLRAATETTLVNLGVEKALAHCHRQSTNSEQFERQFHQWFDGFRTLKFVHGIRDSGWPNCSLQALERETPNLWPIAINEGVTLEALRNAVAEYWGWPPIAALRNE